MSINTVPFQKRYGTNYPVKPACKIKKRRQFAVLIGIGYKEDIFIGAKKIIVALHTKKDVTQMATP
jgi:hypothetical protein